MAAAKLLEVGKEMALLSAVHKIIHKYAKLEPGRDAKPPGDGGASGDDDVGGAARKRRAAVGAAAMAVLTVTRWSEPSRRLLALFFMVRSADIFQGALANRAAIAAAFSVTAGELGRRWRDWPTAPTLHAQFISIMGNLSGVGHPNWIRLANDPRALRQSKGFSWAGNVNRALGYCLKVMTTAYSLQEAIKLVQHLIRKRRRRQSRDRSRSSSDSSEPPGTPTRPMSPAGIPDLLSHPTPQPAYRFDPVKFVTKITRTTSMYIFLSTWTVMLMVTKTLPSSSEAKYLSLKNLKGQLLMGPAFAIFALEPLSRGRLLAEYYITHTIYGVWTDLKLAGAASGAAVITGNLDRLLLPLSTYAAVSTTRHAALHNLLQWAETA